MLFVSVDARCVDTMRAVTHRAPMLVAEVLRWRPRRDLSLRSLRFLAFSVVAAGLLGCSAGGGGPGPQAVPVDRAGSVRGLGVEGQDIVSMTDQMMRDMLATPQLSGRKSAPRVIIDSQYFTNESTQRINTNMITDRLRVSLNRAARGRMMFIGRESAAMVESERDLKRRGITDTGTTGLTRATAGADFRLTGRISQFEARGANGVISRQNQIIFEMVDLESSEIAWSGIYEFKREGSDVGYN